MTMASAGNRGFPTSVASILGLTALSHNHFLAAQVSDVPRRTLYGGQVAAQAMSAAGMTVDHDRIAHSVHGYFLAAGDASEPLILRVTETRDGRRYSVRDVTASQGPNGDRLIVKMTCSFPRPEDGAEFQADGMPAVSAPEDCAP